MDPLVRSLSLDVKRHNTLSTTGIFLNSDYSYNINTNTQESDVCVDNPNQCVNSNITIFSLRPGLEIDTGGRNRAVAVEAMGGIDVGPKNYFESIGSGNVFPLIVGASAGFGFRYNWADAVSANKVRNIIYGQYDAVSGKGHKRDQSFVEAVRVKAYQDLSGDKNIMSENALRAKAYVEFSQPYASFSNVEISTDQKLQEAIGSHFDIFYKTTALAQISDQVAGMVSAGTLDNVAASSMTSQMLKVARENYIKAQIVPIQAQVEERVLRIQSQIGPIVEEKVAETKQAVEDSLKTNLHFMSPEFSAVGGWQVGMGFAQASTASIFLRAGVEFIGTEKWAMHLGSITSVTYYYTGGRGNETNNNTGGVIGLPGGYLEFTYRGKAKEDQNYNPHQVLQESYDNGY